MVMFWVWPFFPSLPGNKQQTTAGTGEDKFKSYYYRNDGLQVLVFLPYLFKTLVCFARSKKKKSLVLQKADDKPAGIHLTKL